MIKLIARLLCVAVVALGLPPGVGNAAPVAPDLNAVYLYPTPFQPSGPNAGTGAGQTGTLAGGVTFTDLPASCSIKIYNTLGVIKKDVEFSSLGLSSYNWDFKDGSSQLLPDDMYYAVISSGTSSKTVYFSKGIGDPGSTVTRACPELQPGTVSTNTYDAVGLINGSVTFVIRGAEAPGVSTPAFSGVAITTFTVHYSSGTEATGFNAEGSTYYVLLSTFNGFNGNFLSTHTLALQTTFYGLSPNTTYFAAAASVVGTSTSAFTALGSTVTLAAAPSTVTFSAVYFTSATVTWEPNGNPPGTIYELNYFSQYGIMQMAFVASTSTVITGLLGGMDQVCMVRAINWSGIPGDFVGVSTHIAAVYQEFPPGAENSVFLNTSNGLAVATVPDGAFASTVTITMVVPPSMPAATGGLAALSTPVGVQVNLGQPLQPAREVTLELMYLTASLGGVDENTLVLARYDPDRNVWLPLPTTRDTANNRVTAPTSHLSLFQIMAAPRAVNFDGVTAGPVPWLASRSPGTPITFRNLPAGAKVRVYTVLGELVYETAADTAGVAVWNGKNKAGEKAASGVYLALLGSGGSSKKMKLVLER